MDNLDDSDNNAKISDSGYSVSCSNSQSRSRCSKSTHSGSNSSGSSGYGGQPSITGSGKPPPAKRSKEKDAKKKKSVLIEAPETQTEKESITELPTNFEQPKAEEIAVDNTAVLEVPPADDELDITEMVQLDTVDSKEEVVSCFMPIGNSSTKSDGFSCVISMHDGVVMYTTPSLTATLGFPKDMWIGRSFIDFVHIKDRSTFASQITNGLAVPSVNGAQEKVTRSDSISTMVCRIRRYRGLTSGFGVKERSVTYMPFLLKLTFKKISDETGDVIYLVVQATALSSAFKEPNEVVVNSKPFIMRHSPDGKLEYIDPEAVSYLGYLPQDLIGKDVLQLYHQNDLAYLTQVYETIVQKGGLAKSDPYRMMTQNRDYIKLETEWTSFINPWSRKLEFIIGKHHILEGPRNPDVFHSPVPEKLPKVTEEEKKKQQGMRDNMIKIMNEVLTKPAKLAKQQMSKRCQDLESFMESLMEEPPKPDIDLRMDINDQEHSFYERDSMLGGISPHHDCNDSKSSTETPPSYNQLNYNETIQRYFERHQPLSFEDYNNLSEEFKLSLKNPKLHISSPNCLSPLTQNFGELGDLTSSCESNPAVTDASPVSLLSDQQQIRLTETLLIKHNAEMEKEMLKVHRETRSSKEEREKLTIGNRQKKKEHLARCNASFQLPATETPVEPAKNKLQGAKRTSKPMELDNVSPKQHCPTSRQPQRRQTATTKTAEVPLPSTVTTSMAASHWYNNQVNCSNAFLLGVGMPQQMPLMDPAISHPMVAIPGIPVQCLMYGQAVYGSPIMYSAIGPQLTYPVPQPMMSQSMRQPNLLYNQINNPQVTTSVNMTTPKQQTTEAVSVPAPSSSAISSGANVKPTEEIVDKTDGESSYSSFYSSFFKTESGSAEESDPKKCNNKPKEEATTSQEKDEPCQSSSTTYVYNRKNQQKNPPRRKMKPSWMEQVCVTSELIYKYQIMTKPLEEVLESDKEKMKELIQPSLVNEQLGQLYLDLQLEGVAARLTLEEGMTSSSSSGEESANYPRRKREYSKLVMIYEEDAPLPPPNCDDDVIPLSDPAI